MKEYNDVKLLELCELWVKRMVKEKEIEYLQSAILAEYRSGVSYDHIDPACIEKLKHALYDLEEINSDIFILHRQRNADKREKQKEIDNLKRKNPAL